MKWFSKTVTFSIRRLTGLLSYSVMVAGVADGLKSEALPNDGFADLAFLVDAPNDFGLFGINDQISFSFFGVA